MFILHENNVLITQNLNLINVKYYLLFLSYDFGVKCVKVLIRFTQIYTTGQKFGISTFFF